MRSDVSTVALLPASAKKSTVRENGLSLIVPWNVTGQTSGTEGGSIDISWQLTIGVWVAKNPDGPPSARAGNAMLMTGTTMVTMQTRTRLMCVSPASVEFGTLRQQ